MLARKVTSITQGRAAGGSRHPTLLCAWHSTVEPDTLHAPSTTHFQHFKFAG